MDTVTTSPKIGSSDSKDHEVDINIFEMGDELKQKPLSEKEEPIATAPATTSPAAITIPSNFAISEADGKLDPKPKNALAKPAPPSSPPLGALTSFTGVFAGKGFNLIFRPNSGPPTTTTFPNPISPPAPQAPSENVLELNLTTETLTFSKPLGSVPNRGLITQNDIFLNGVPYVQSISDVTNVATGKADATPSGIHFEPGLWMHVPATTSDPKLGESLVRMASIPHGTTINAQSVGPTITVAGPPIISAVDITPFLINSSPPQKIPFIAQTATNVNTPRLPQDLAKFIAAGTITQAILTDPNTILRNDIKGQTITKTVVFTVSTNPPSSEQPADGITNIAFLQGDKTSPNGANADAAQMSATFWIETVQHHIVVPPFKPGQAPLKLRPAAPHPDAQVPVFEVTPPHEITVPKTIVVTSTQIQYSQTVFLNFAGLTWPHVSVATLVPTAAQVVPPTAWN